MDLPCLDRSAPAHSVARELAHRPSKAARPDRVADHRDRGCSLPGEWFSVAEGIIAIQFAWPLFLAIAVGHRRWDGDRCSCPRRLHLLHDPFAFPIFVGGACALLAGQSSSDSRRARAGAGGPARSWQRGSCAGSFWRAANRATRDCRGSGRARSNDVPPSARDGRSPRRSDHYVPSAHPTCAPGRTDQLFHSELCVLFLHVSHWALALSYRLPFLVVTAPFVLLMFVAAATAPVRPTVTAAGVRRQGPCSSLCSRPGVCLAPRADRRSKRHPLRCELQDARRRDKGRARRHSLGDEASRLRPRGDTHPGF